MFANLLASQAVLLSFAGLLIAVAIGDIRELTIPNRYCAAIVLLYPVYAVTAPHGVDWVDGAIVGAVALVIGFLLYSMRLAGGGDVKFFSAVALWAGSAMLVELVFVTSLVGGIVAAVMLIHRRLTAPKAAPSGIGLTQRAMASVFGLLGGLIMTRTRAVAQASAGAQEPASSSSSERVPAVGTLPYGAAISVGGIVVAAMLLMRG